jgi:hypothetical protein
MSSSFPPRIMSEIPTICVAIFHLPSFEAAIVMPRLEAIERRPDTANSRPMMMHTAQASAS